MTTRHASHVVRLPGRVGDVLVGGAPRSAGATYVTGGMWRRRPGHRRRWPRVVHLERVDRIRRVVVGAGVRADVVAVNDDPVCPAVHQRRWRHAVMVDRPHDLAADLILVGEVHEHEVVVEGGWPTVIQRPGQSIGPGIPARFDGAVRMVVVVQPNLVEDARADRVQDHLCAGGTAVIVGVLLVVVGAEERGDHLRLPEMRRIGSRSRTVRHPDVTAASPARPGTAVTLW